MVTEIKYDVATTEKTFCDICKEKEKKKASVKCEVCGKDICAKHTIDITTNTGINPWPMFSVELCPPCFYELLVPTLKKIDQKIKETKKSPQVVLLPTIDDEDDVP